LTVGTAYFDKLCRHLRREFHVVTLQEIFRILRDGDDPPPRTLAITFDDCYRDNLFAAQVLTKNHSWNRAGDSRYRSDGQSRAHGANASDATPSEKA